MAFAYYSNSFGDFSPLSLGSSTMSLMDDIDSATNIIGSAESDDEYAPCNCGCPASQTVTWVTSLIDGLGEDDQRKAVNMLMNHYKHMIGKKSSLVNGSAESSLGSAAERLGSVAERLGSAAERLGSALLIDGVATIDGWAEKSKTVDVDLSSSLETALNLEEEELDFSYGDDKTVSSDGFRKVPINSISDAKDEFLSENADYEQIEINFNSVDEPLSYDIGEDMTKELFEIFDN